MPFYDFVSTNFIGRRKEYILNNRTCPTDEYSEIIYYESDMIDKLTI